MSSYDQYLKIKMCSLGISGQMRHRKMTPDVLAHTTAHHTNVCVLYSMAKKETEKRRHATKSQNTNLNTQVHRIFFSFLWNVD